MECSLLLRCVMGLFALVHHFLALNQIHHYLSSPKTFIENTINFLLNVCLFKVIKIILLIRQVLAHLVLLASFLSFFLFLLSLIVFLSPSFAFLLELLELASSVNNNIFLIIEPITKKQFKVFYFNFSIDFNFHLNHFFFFRLFYHYFYLLFGVFSVFIMCHFRFLFLYYLLINLYLD